MDTQTAQPPKETEYCAYSQDVVIKIDNLHEMICKLQDRLSPVLKALGPEEERAENKGEATPLLETLNLYSNRISDAEERISDIIERCIL